MGSDRRIGDFVQLQRGTTYKGMLVGHPGPALLGLGSIVPGGGFRNDFKTYGGDCPPELMLSPGDLYVSLKGATKDGDMIGSVARVPDSVASGRLTQDTVKLILGDASQDFARYLYWLLRTPDYRHYCASRATGSAVSALSRTDFLAYPVPELTHRRRRIVHLLEVVDEKFESNRATLGLLDQLSRSTFTRWRANTSMTEGTTFGDFAVVFGGSTPKTTVAEYWGGSLAWTTPTDVTGLPSPYLFSTNRTISESGLASCTAVMHPTGSIFMTSRATIGAFAVNQILASTNQGFIVVRPRHDVDRWFLFEEMRSRVQEFLDNANGSTFLEISRGRFKQLPLAVPPIDHLIALDRELKPLHEKAIQVATESQQLERLRDTLLAELISGRIPGPEAAEAIA